MSRASKNDVTTPTYPIISRTSAAEIDDDTGLVLYDSTVTEAQAAASIGSTMLILVSAFFIIILVSDIEKLYKDMKRGYKNIRCGFV